MKRWLRACFLAFVVAFVAGAPLAAAAAEGDPGSAPAVDDRQVLLLLRLPPEHFRPENAYSGGYGDGAAHGARRRLAAALAREHGLTLVTDWAMPLLGVDCFVLDVPADRQPTEVAEALSGDARVAWAQPMHLYRTQGHDDPLFSLQPATEAWQLSRLHAVATGRGVRVAVVDSAVDAHHPDLEGQVAVQQDFLDDRRDGPEIHGTAVAGLVAARADNGIGIAGIAPDARLLALRACRQQSADATLCTSLSLAMALHFAITHDADVINLSLSGPPDRLLDRLLDVALARRIDVIGAVDRRAADGGFPASHPGVVAVADDTRPPVPRDALAAPGHDLPTTLPGGRWGLVSGASFAAAQVAGLLALVRERRPAGTGATTRSDIATFPDGTIDACATLTRAAGTEACPARTDDTAMHAFTFPAARP